MFFDAATLVFLAGYLCAFTIFAALYRRIEINFFWLSGGIFLVYILPKLVAFLISGDQVFLPGSARLDSASANAGIICILAFMSAILGGYAISHVVFHRPDERRVGMAPDYDPEILRLVAIWIFVPLFVALFPAYWIAAEVSFDALFAKRELIQEGQRTFAWVLQKCAQVVKSGFYLALLALVLTRDPRYLRPVFLLAALTAIVFLVSSQRAGILILGLEVALALQVAGILRVRYLVAIVGGFAVLNVAILSARAFGTDQSLYWTDLIYRRYFFDLEKIAALVEYFVSDPLYRFNAFGILASHADPVVITYNPHFFLAEKVFGIGGGVPPSILGEMIMYLGPVWIVPLTVVLTMVLIWCERLVRHSPRPLIQLILVVVLSKLYFLTLNSDTASSFNRIILDLVLLGAGLLIYSVFAGVARARTHA